MPFTLPTEPLSDTVPGAGNSFQSLLSSLEVPSLFENNLYPNLQVENNVGIPELREVSRAARPQHEQPGSRFLGDDFQSVLVDGDGNEYEPYSLAWRYLGMYMDCDERQLGDDDDDNGSGDRRRRLSGSGDGNDCSRKVLWAAYVDPRYRGGTIGEYQFFDLETETWDTSICKTRRCSKMNCHEPNTHFKLVGVYKETDGLYDWAEQLFKHEGYCIWDDDTYEFMAEYLEKWPSGCTQLYYGDYSGNTLYADLKPLPEGNMSVGIYFDEYCAMDSNLTFSDYVLIYYANVYGDSDQGQEAAEEWDAAIVTWNDALTVYKACQPCRAYNLNKISDHVYEVDDDGWDADADDDDDHGNDGEGYPEQWGYNCYDDADYLNVDQCYKFQAKTDMEEAATDDLVTASRQGTMLAIRVNGRMYGKGRIHSGRGIATILLKIVLLIAVGMGLGAFLFMAYRKYRIRRVLALPPSMNAMKQQLDDANKGSRPREEVIFAAYGFKLVREADFV